MFGVIYAAAEADRYGFLLEQLRRNAQSGVKSYVIVPEQFSVSTERKVIETLGVSSQTLIEVLTFSRLGNEVLSMLGPLRLNYIDGAGREVLARRALHAVESELTYLKSNVNRRGFSSTLAELVSEFKRYGIMPEDLNAAAEKTDKEVLGAKLRDLSRFYQVYTALIEEKHADAEDNLAIALERLDQFPMPEGSELFIAEFKSFTPLEYSVLTELMQKTAKTRLLLCCDDPERPSDIFASAAETYRSLKSAAEERGIEICRPERLGRSRAEDRPEFLHLWNNFFSVNPKRYDGRPEHLHILSPLGHYDEAEQSARIIRKLIRTKGYKQSDFLILARDFETYDRIIPLIFKKYGLNVFVDLKRSIMQNPFVQSLAAMLEITAYGFSYERAAVMAKSGFASGLSAAEIDIFDNYLLAVSPSHAMWNDEEPWKFNPDENEYDMELINRVKDAVLGPVYRLKSKIRGRKTAGEIISAVFEYINECKCEATMRRLCREYSDSGMVYLAEEYRRIWNSVISVLSRIDEIMGDEQVTYETFYEIFTSACAGTKVGISPQTLDEVTFSKIDLFRSIDAKVVIVLGVNYGVFPKGYSAEGLISDNEREILREYGIRLAMTAAEKSEDEQNLVYNVLSAASDELYLMAPCIDNSGEKLEPSKIITKIRGELFDPEYFKNEDEDASILGFESPDAAFEELKRICAQCGGENLTPDEKAVLEYFLNDKKAEAALTAFLERLRRAREGCDELSKSAALKLYGHEIMLSASKLEKFNSCAFSYFMRYGLVLKPRDKAVFDPMSMGNVLHASLERYFSDKQAQNADYDKITREDCENEIAGIVRGLAEGAGNMMYETSAYYKYLIMRISGIAAATAWETVKFYKNSDFRPYGFEISIGDSGDVPPLVIRTPSGSAKINGFVDRADSAVIDGEKYISIVDYKSSVRELEEHLAADGVHFQPLVYANALCGGLDMRPAAMLYQQMNDPIIDGTKIKTDSDIEAEIHKNVKTCGWVVDDVNVDGAFDKTKKFVLGRNTHIPAEEMRLRLEEASKKISETAEGIFSGVISINPYKKWGFDPCRYCDYQSICNENV